jgi:hypothetical protein
LDYLIGVRTFRDLLIGTWRASIALRDKHPDKVDPNVLKAGEDALRTADVLLAVISDHETMMEEACGI